MIAFSRKEVPKLKFGNALPINHELLRTYERPASVRITSVAEVAASQVITVESVQPAVQEETISEPKTLRDLNMLVPLNPNGVANPTVNDFAQIERAS